MDFFMPVPTAYVGTSTHRRMPAAAGKVLVKDRDWPRQALGKTYRQSASLSSKNGDHSGQMMVGRDEHVAMKGRVRIKPYGTAI